MARALDCVEIVPIRSWNYRVAEFVTEDGEVWRSIHDVHYVGDVSMAYSVLPATVMWEKNDGEASALLTRGRLHDALSTPVLEEIDFRANDSACNRQVSTQ